MRKDIEHKVDTSPYKTIALVPGGFKPPHSGHLAMIEDFMKRSDMIYIIFGSGGAKPRKINDITISPQITRKIFEIYLQDLGMSNYQFIELGDKELSRITNRKATPMDVAYSIMQLDTYSNQTVIMGASSKDALRFKGMTDAYVPRDEYNIPLINLDVEPYPARSLSGIGELSSSKMRFAIENNNFEMFKAFIPHASQYRADDIWTLLGGEKEVDQEEVAPIVEVAEKKSSITPDLFSLVEQLLNEALGEESYQGIIDAMDTLDKVKAAQAGASDAINKTVAAREKAIADKSRVQNMKTRIVNREKLAVAAELNAITRFKDEYVKLTKVSRDEQAATAELSKAYQALQADMPELSSEDLEQIKTDIEDLKRASEEKPIEVEPIESPPGTSPEEKEEEAAAETAAAAADKEAKEAAAAGIEEPELEEASTLSGGNIAIGLGNKKRNSLIREKEDELIETIMYNIIKTFGSKLNAS